jgi:hypothetical protein
VVDERDGDMPIAVGHHELRNNNDTERLTSVVVEGS